VDLSTYWWVPSYNQERQLDSVIHLMEHDINQEVYGLPEYLAALNSAWLNESATCSAASITRMAATPASSCT
jgi:capsid portal protein